MKKQLANLLRVGVVAALSSALINVQAAPVNYTLAGASPSGLWTLLGAGLDGAIKAANPGSVVTYQTSSGGFANAALVNDGKVALGLAHDAELAIAVAGEDPYKAPLTDIRAIGYLYNWAPMQIISSQKFAQKYHLDNISDLVENKAPARITVNRPGNITGRIAMSMLEAVGATEDAIDKQGGTIIRAGSSEQSTMFQNGRVDIFTNGVFVGHSSIRELENSQPIALLDIPDSVIQKVGKQYHIGDFTIPANSYGGQDKPVRTLTLGAVLIVNASMADDEAYALTKAIIDHIDKIKDIHPSMKALTPELLATSTAVEIHPGAERAFKEAGLR